ncbi:hypothetical protein SALBM311S_08331 [Streptomyces alboniger]
MNRIKPVSRRMLSVEVVRKEWRPGGFLLVTVGGEDLEDFRPIGVDQAFRLLFRRPGQGRLWLPSRSDATWMAQYMMTGKAVRPYVRFYTVRHFWPDRNELDIEFVLHEGDSPASTWARGARPGEPVGILDEGATDNPPHGVEWQLLVGDETAVPADLVHPGLRRGRVAQRSVPGGTQQRGHPEVEHATERQRALASARRPRRTSGALARDTAMMTAPLGTGVNLAMLDAGELALALANAATVDDAIRVYEKTMLPRSIETAQATEHGTEQLLSADSSARKLATIVANSLAK